MRVVVAATLALAVLAAGCSGRDDSNGSGHPEGPADVVPSLDFTFEVAGCRELTLVLLVSFEQAGRTTPPGFTPADASVLLGSPAPTGQAAVLLTNAICQTASNDPNGYAEGAIAVLVEDPGVPGVAAAPYNFYEAGLVTPDGATRTGLEAAGWNLVGKHVESNVGMLGPLFTGDGTVAENANDGASVLYSVSSGAPPVPQTLSGTFRWWQALPAGLGYVDYTFNTAGYFGSAECSIAAGSLASEVAGMQNCGPGAGVVGILPEFTGSVAFHHLPGVTVS